MDVPDKLRREYERVQEPVVRRPTFEQHPSSVSLVDSSPLDDRPLYSPPQASLAAPPPLHPYPSHQSSSSSIGIHALPTVHQPDKYAPAPLPELYSPRSILSSDKGHDGGRTWGESGQWGYGQGFSDWQSGRGIDEVDTQALPERTSDAPAWPPHLPPLTQQPHLRTADATSDYGVIRGASRRRGGTFLRSLLPSSIPTRLYLALVLLQSVLVLAMLVLLVLHYYALEGADFKFLNATSEQRRLPVWLGVFALASVWFFGMAVEGLRARNIIQILGLTVFNIALLTYSIIQVSEIRSVFEVSENSEGDPKPAVGLRLISVDLLSVLLPVAIGLGELGYVVLSWLIYREFGWETYKALGADRTIKRAYMRYNIFCCLCKFDVFFFLGFSIQLIYLVLGKDFEYYITIVALPLSLALLALGWLSARRELRSGMFAFILGLLVGSVYFCFKLYRIYTENNALQTVIKSLTVFAALSLALLLATLGMTVVVLRNFGQGLKQGLDRKHNNERGKGKTGVGYHGGRSPLDHNLSQPRMSIE